MVTLPINEQMLADTDTLMVFGLDHMITEQEAAAEEIEALKQFLLRQGTCLLIGRHHDVGNSQDPKRLQMEYSTTAIRWSHASSALGCTHNHS